jgi:hypothetical protein
MHDAAACKRSAPTAWMTHVLSGRVTPKPAGVQLLLLSVTSDPRLAPWHAHHHP